MARATGANGASFRVYIGGVNARASMRRARVVSRRISPRARRRRRHRRANHAQTYSLVVFSPRSRARAGRGGVERR